MATLSMVSGAIVDVASPVLALAAQPETHETRQGVRAASHLRNELLPSGAHNPGAWSQRLDTGADKTVCIFRFRGPRFKKPTPER